MNKAKTVTIPTEEYSTLLRIAEYVKNEENYRKAPLNARRAAEQHLRLLEETEQMDTVGHYLHGYNCYAEIKVTESDLHRMRKAYQEQGMYGLLPMEYQI